MSVPEKVESRTLPGTSKRPEIQALRAVAVGLVVVYHLAQPILPGGYVGVDVFFVISGYLIISHLSREILSTGSIAIGRFYARRILRLLPASLMVLAVTSFLTWAFLPKNLWVETGQQIAASAFYVQNWVLAGNAVDYSASSADASPVQHYWSLSVEEQFYAFFPILLAAAALVARRRSQRPRRYLILTLGVITLLSFVYSVMSTAENASSAYFITPTRVWEFGVGGLLWFLVQGRSINALVRLVLSWSGVVIIVGSAFTFSDTIRFPGAWAAIPVVGTAAVIAAGDINSRWSLQRLFNWGPTQYVGGISYSLYLWHWPLVVILPFAFSTTLTIPMRILILVASLLLAGVSKHFVEDPIMRMDLVRVNSGVRKLSMIFLTTMTAMACITAPAAAMSLSAQSQIRTAIGVLNSERDELPGDIGAPSADEFAFPGGAVFPPALAAAEDGIKTDSFGTVCQDSGPFTAIKRCTFGAAAGKKVALVGDSHAMQWLPAIAEIAETEGWTLSTYIRASCPLNDLPHLRASDDGGACIKWVQATTAHLRTEKYDSVIISSYSANRYAAGTHQGDVSDGLASVWKEITAAGSEIVVIRDTPIPERGGVIDVPACIERDENAVAQCAVPRDEAVLNDPQELAASRTPGARLIDLNDRMCSKTECPAIIGGAIVYRDGHHLTRTFVLSLQPYLRTALGLPKDLPSP